MKSILTALAGGLWWGLGWLDPAVAIVGALVIGRWAVGVLRHSSRALVDASAPPKLAAQIRALIEGDGDAKLADLHVWQVGPQAYAAAARFWVYPIFVIIVVGTFRSARRRATSRRALATA